MNAPTEFALPQLQDPRLFRMQCYVDGGWMLM